MYALVACAAARPSEPNIANKSSEESNGISGLDVHTKLVGAMNISKDVEGSTEVAKAEVKVCPALSKPLHEQHPHALLFGTTCGGTIISPMRVLTAALCTIDADDRWSVTAGTNNSRDGSGEVRRVKRLVIHPRFSVGPFWLDADEFYIDQVAANWDFLPELEEPLPLDGKTIAAVELDDGPSIPEGLDVGYAGYGTATHGGYMQSKMHSKELRVIPDSKCKEALVQYDAESMVCTEGRPPKLDSACQGDSGSGLVANGKLYGLLSWGQDDAHRCDDGAFVVFARVAAVRDWIRQVTSV